MTLPFVLLIALNVHEWMVYGEIAQRQKTALGHEHAAKATRRAALFSQPPPLPRPEQ
jgi:hypothetical protein